MSKKQLNKLILDIADSVSESTESANAFLEEQNIDVSAYVNKGLAELNIKKESKVIVLTKSQTFFRRVVLGAEIAYKCHNERTFGSVKFQKLLYLCEHASKMNFATNYSKQAAGPFDNKLMHSIRGEFKKQKWFKVESVKNGKYTKINFTPLNNVDNYKQYYNKYYGSINDDIQFIINLFQKSYTNDVELVATIFACWDEIIKEKSIFSNALIIQKVYAWSKQKKKFSENQIIKKIDWMREVGITPY